MPIRRVLGHFGRGLPKPVKKIILKLGAPLFSRRVSSPIERFKRDGWSDKLYGSVPTTNNAVVVVFGGYLGDSASGWLNRLPSAKIHVFEPVKTFADAISKRFPEGVKVYPFGIGARDETRIFKLAGDWDLFNKCQTKRGGLEDLDPGCFQVDCVA